MEILIDLAGHLLEARARNVAVAISKLGYIHIRSIDRPVHGRPAALERIVIVTLRPQLVLELTVAAAGYEIADLKPERTVVVAESAKPQCWVFPGHMLAIVKIASLVRKSEDACPPLLAELHQSPM
jgi:phenylpyruvate tautomerase PptA (4-oxalocrotonate tautomerase family)